MGKDTNIDLLPPRSLVNGALVQLVGIRLREEVHAREQSHQHLLLQMNHDRMRECNAVAP